MFQTSIPSLMALVLLVKLAFGADGADSGAPDVPLDTEVRRESRYGYLRGNGLGMGTDLARRSRQNTTNAIRGARGE